jgi:O-antigen ligase
MVMRHASQPAKSVRVPVEGAISTGDAKGQISSGGVDGRVRSLLGNVRGRRGPTFLSAFVVLTAVAFADGGYFGETWVWTTLALASLAWVALVLRDAIEVGRLELVGIAALTCFVGWMALSAAWSPTPEETIKEAERALIYVAGFLGVTLLLDRGRLREYFSGIAAATIVVVAYAIVEHLLDSSARDPTQGTLLIEPFGYANALGIFATLGVLVSLGLALSAKSKAERVTWIAGIALLITALIETESRGAGLALAAGLFVLTILRWKRIAGRTPAVRASLAIAAPIALLALVATVALRANDLLGPRVDYWTVALSQWQENMVLGSGAGTFALYWLREGRPSVVLDAHSLYVETLAEVGPVGLVLLTVTLAVPIVAAVRGRDDPLAAIGAAAYVAYLVHAGLDWDWEMPAVTLAGLLCGIGVLVGVRQDANGITVGPRARGGLAVVVLVIAVLAVTSSVTL